MAVRRELVVTEVLRHGDADNRAEDIRVIVDEDSVLILTRDEQIMLEFSREEWEQIDGFVRWSWQPPTMGGRE